MSGPKKGVNFKEITVFFRRLRKIFKTKKSAKKLGYNKLITDEEQRCGFNLIIKT